MNQPYPHKECDDCTGIGDCPNPDIALNGFGTPIAPEDCPKKDKINNHEPFFRNKQSKASDRT
jgi:hypothetical protein